MLWGSPKDEASGWQIGPPLEPPACLTRWDKCPRKWRNTKKGHRRWRKSKKYKIAIQPFIDACVNSMREDIDKEIEQRDAQMDNRGARVADAERRPRLGYTSKRYQARHR